MRRVFISYPFHDREARMFARFLHEHLPSLGVEPVAVDDALEAGDNWQMGITDQINKCSVFISFVDRENPNVMFELGYALAKNKKIIIVGDFERMPSDLRSMTYVPRDSHPYDVLMHVEKYLSRDVGGLPPFASVDIENPQAAVIQLLERPDLLDTIGPREFEDLIARWFVSKGMHIEQSMAARDYGYDLLVEPFRNNRAVVEVKRYKSTSQVPLTVVRQLLGSMVPDHIPYGIVVSSAPFTKSAMFFAQDIEPTILLWTLEDLAEMDKMPNKSVDTYESRRADAP